MKKITVGLFVGSLILLPLFAYSAPSLAEKMKGKILLAVEDRGKTFYVHTDGNRYQITTSTAQKIFEKLAIGVKNSDLQQIPLKDLSVSPAVVASASCPVSVATQCDYSSYQKQIADLKIIIADLRASHPVNTVTTDSLNKEYGLKINAVKQELVDLEFLTNHSAELVSLFKANKDYIKLDPNFSNYVDFVTYQSLSDSSFKQQTIQTMFYYLAWNGSNNPGLDITKYLNDQTATRNTKIATLKNELEKKLLELQ